MNSDYLKRIERAITKGTTKSSNAGFNLIMLLGGIVTIGTIKAVEMLVKVVRKMILNSRENKLKKIEHEKLVNKFISMIRSNYYNISFSITKTTIDYTGEMKRYINLYTYNKLSGTIENINELTNKVLYDTLTISTKRGDLQDTILIVDNDLEIIKRDLEDVTGCEVQFKYIEQKK